MKKILFLPVAAIAALAALITSCDKDDVFNLAGCRITRAYSADSSYVEIVYDRDKIEKYYYKRKNGNIVSTHNYDYTTSGKISAIFSLDSTGANVSAVEYQYDSQDRVLTEVNYGYPGGVLTQQSYIAYTYYTNGRVQSASRYTFPGPVLQETYYYTDFDANGNNTKGYHNNGLGVTLDTFFYTYDNKPYPFKYTFYHLQFHNNTLEFREKYTAGGPDYVVNYTYTYNAQGYPVSRYYVQMARTERFDYECGD